MKPRALTRHYGALTPEERFRLILAAGGRQDLAEQDRLVMAGGRITYSLPDHAPYAYAFDDVAQLVYLELLEEAHRYRDALHLAKEEGAESDPETARLNDALAVGFELRTKAEGWRLFCERLHVPPLALWESLPGFDRLRRALALAEKAAFVPEGFLRWLNDGRPAGQPELTGVPLCPEQIARSTDEAFRQRVRWWDG